MVQGEAPLPHTTGAEPHYTRDLGVDLGFASFMVGLGYGSSGYGLFGHGYSWHGLGLTVFF